MDRVWLHTDLGLEIMKGDEIYRLINETIKDMTANVIDIATLVKNMSTVLTHKDPEEREKGMKYFTFILKNLPVDFLNASQLKFIATFYTDRLKDNHRVIPPVLDGYLAIVNMNNYPTLLCQHFFTALFKDVACQSQVKEDRRNIYFIVKKILEKDPDCLKAMGPDFLYGFISSMDGERCPVNLNLLFSFLPTLVRTVPLGHLTDEMFDVISCYFPVDFNSASEGAGGVTRTQLAEGLAPCLCAVPDFAEQCLPLLLEKLDSGLKTAKMDSLKLLVETCKTFKPQAYYPFLKALSASIQRELSHKSDPDLPATAHHALYTLVASIARTANTDEAFENFVRSLLINCQCSVSECKTLAQFEPPTKTLLTVANASKDACRIIGGVMIPAMITYYDLCFQDNTKLQLGCLDFLAAFYQIAQRWDLSAELGDLSGIARLLLTAASNTSKDYQMVAFKNLVKTVPLLNDDLIVPFIEILMHNIHHSNDTDLVDQSVETICSIGKQYPTYVRDLILKGKVDLKNLTNDKPMLKKRLKLLSKIASIDDFTDSIMEELLNIIINGNTDDALEVISALDSAITEGSYADDQIIRIESKYDLVSNISQWATKRISNSIPIEELMTGLNLISDTMSKLNDDAQLRILERHSNLILDRCQHDSTFILVLEAMHRSLLPSVYADHFLRLTQLAIEVCFDTSDERVARSACLIIAHILNKAEAEKFEALYGAVTDKLKLMGKEDLSERLIMLSAYLAKALVLRGRQEFTVWFDKVVEAVLQPRWGECGAAGVAVVASDAAAAGTASPLHRQRVWQRWLQLGTARPGSSPLTPRSPGSPSELRAWAHLLDTLPHSLLQAHDDTVVHVCCLLVGAGPAAGPRAVLAGARALRVLCASGGPALARSLHTALPALCRLAAPPAAMPMEVRIAALQCVQACAQACSTAALLPLRREVAALLRPALDDRKRLVRCAARAAALRWSLVGAPGEDKDD